MNFDCSSFNYKIVTIFEIFPKIYKNKHEMIIITKRFGSYVSLRNLIFALWKVHCSLRKVPFSRVNNCVSRAREGV
jgi:hypothetical protein